MEAFLKFPPGEQRVYLEEAQSRLNLPPASIEKDFWVSWILRELFRLEGWGEYLTFKGGTSLSKAWKLIERFSEDIDIVIDRDFLGFGGSDSPEKVQSNKQREKRLKSLKAKCQEKIREDLHPALNSRLESVLPSNSEWFLTMATAEEDADQQTLLFQYPGVFAESVAYLNPVVRIEMGARSDTAPYESPTLAPLLSEAFPNLLDSPEFTVRTVASRRTFWEKAMLLHEETYRPPDKKRKARLARHYYDLWSMIQKGVADDALDDIDLFHEIVSHREIFFRYTWMDYRTIQPGTLRVVPLDDQVSVWKSDYQSMKDEMFYGEPPTFEEILRVVGGFERKFNQGG